MRDRERQVQEDEDKDQQEGQAVNIVQPSLIRVDADEVELSSSWGVLRLPRSRILFTLSSVSRSSETSCKASWMSQTSP
eukprot:113836-Hanusia_phi.AAC.1